MTSNDVSASSSRMSWRAANSACVSLPSLSASMGNRLSMSVAAKISSAWIISAPIWTAAELSPGVWADAFAPKLKRQATINSAVRMLQVRRSSAGAMRLSLRDGEVHVGCVIKNTGTVGARDDFLFGLAGHDGAAAQLHVTTAADAVLNSDHNVVALLLEQTLVTAARAFVHRRGQFLAVGLQLRQFRLQVALTRRNIGQP